MNPAHPWLLIYPEHSGTRGGIVGKNYVDIENDQGATLRYRKHANGRGLVAHGAKAVSYTHLTLPTIYSV